jgi:two-component system phosphate regulon sensor histidine kinase PhoR
VWNEIKSNLLSSRVYLKEILLLDAAVILLLYILLPGSSVHLTAFIILFVLNLILLDLIGKKRNAELDEIKLTINNIRRNLFDEAGEIKLSKNLQGLQEDIKQMFEKTKSDIENMQRLQRVRTEFLANVSHELRTPIFAIQGYLETLLNGKRN